MNRPLRITRDLQVDGEIERRSLERPILFGEDSSWNELVCWAGFKSEICPSEMTLSRWADDGGPQP
jgi:hypothetical protein